MNFTENRDEEDGEEQNFDDFVHLLEWVESRVDDGDGDGVIGSKIAAVLTTQNWKFLTQTGADAVFILASSVLLSLCVFKGSLSSFLLLLSFCATIQFLKHFLLLFYYFRYLCSHASSSVTIMFCDFTSFQRCLTSLIFHCFKFSLFVPK